MIELYKVETGNFKLDGGAIFGVIPKVMWNKVYSADKNNLCNFSMRCLLVKEEDRLTLIDCGMGNKQSEKFFSYYYLNGKDTLEKSLQVIGVSKSEITDVILTHLHFDHCGGAVEKDNSGKFSLTFPEANYWVSGPQWHWAMVPNQREKASYLKENLEPIEASGKLKFITNPGKITPSISVKFFNGHTEGLIVPYIQYGSYTVVFTADLIPTAAHLPPSWICGFDTRPLISMQERNQFLNDAADNGYILFFEHDINNECCTIKKQDKGHSFSKLFSFEEFINNEF